MAAATDGVAFERLVVIFLKRAPRCIRAARLGHRSRSRRPGIPVEGQIAAYFCSPMVRDHQPVKIKEWVAGKVGSKERIECWEETYYVIEDFMFRIDHILIYMSRCCEQLALPFLPPWLVGFSDEGGWYPGWQINIYSTSVWRVLSYSDPVKAAGDCLSWLHHNGIAEFDWQLTESQLAGYCWWIVELISGVGVLPTTKSVHWDHLWG